MRKSTLIKIYQYLAIKKKIITNKIDDLIHNPTKKRKGKYPLRYIHIGYPKSASTALQKGYLGRHNQLLHLGCGNPVKKDYWDDHGYISAEVNKVMEIDLRFKNSFSYNAAEVKSVFDHYFKIADEDENIHAVGISNENFSFNWHGGIDVSEKAKRLYDIFGKGTKIVMILRNQKTLIESLYKENIRFGYAGTFDDFLNYMWNYKDRNFTYEFCFQNVIKTYEELFGANNIEILFFEDLKNDKEAFVKSFSKAIGAEYYTLNMDKEYNKQLDLKELSIKRMLNAKYPHTFGKGKYETVDTHRYVPYFTEELGVEVPDDVYIDYFTRSHFNKLSNVLKEKIVVDDIEINWDSTVANKLLNLK
jgi:hypothetical protein